MQSEMDKYKKGRQSIYLRQRDYNTPNYRIVPYKSTVNATVNDYFSNTISQLQKEIYNASSDYRSLAETMWTIFSEIDRIEYDKNLMFQGLKNQQIYDKISLIRSLNAYEPQQESLRLSAIVKVDENSPICTTQYNNPVSKMIQSQIQNNLIRRKNLYEIQQQQECYENISNVDDKLLCRQKNQKRINNVSEPNPVQNSSNHRRSLSQLSGQKRESNRASLLLKEKISLAFHQQQELRQILEQQLEKLTKQLDEKRDFLDWTVEQLNVRDSLIQKLKSSLLQRDEAFESEEKMIDQDDVRERVEEKDREIGVLINSLIERTEETVQDLEYLIKSLKGDCLTKGEKNECFAKLDKNEQIFEQNEQKDKNQSSQNKANESIYLQEGMSLMKDDQDDRIATSVTIQQEGKQDNEWKNCQQIHPENQESNMSEIVLMPKSMNLEVNCTKVDQLQSSKKQKCHQTQDNQNKNIFTYSNGNSPKITLLTKEHFLLAQNRKNNKQNLSKQNTQNPFIPNVTMTSSLTVQID